MDETTQAIAAGVLRHVLTAGAGILVADGYIQSSQTQQAVGAVMFLIGVGWSWWQKTGQAQVTTLLKKMTNKATTAGAVTAAQALPTGAALNPGLKPGGAIGK